MKKILELSQNEITTVTGGDILMNTFIGAGVEFVIGASIGGYLGIFASIYDRQNDKVTNVFRGAVKISAFFGAVGAVLIGGTITIVSAL